MQHNRFAVANKAHRHSRMSATSDIYVRLGNKVVEDATEALAAAIAPGGSIVIQESDKIQ